MGFFGIISVQLFTGKLDIKASSPTGKTARKLRSGSGVKYGREEWQCVRLWRMDILLLIEDFRKHFTDRKLQLDSGHLQLQREELSRELI